MKVLVTGAGSGIGRATAEVLAARGHVVVATARRVEALDGLDVAMRLSLDVTSDSSVEQCLSAAGDIDVLVNNAGISETGPLETYPQHVLEKMFDTNVYGSMRMVRAIVPGMRHRGSGVVVNVTSVEGKVSAPLSGAYCATKHAMEALSESLAFEVGHFGIRVVIIEPGYISPGMRNATRHGEDGTVYEQRRAQWRGADETLVGAEGRPGPELVGEAIAKAIEDPQTPLRVPVGADAEMVLAARKELDDASFEAAMRSLLGIDW